MFIIPHISYTYSRMPLGERYRICAIWLWRQKDCYWYDRKKQIAICWGYWRQKKTTKKTWPWEAGEIEDLAMESSLSLLPCYSQQVYKTILSSSCLYIRLYYFPSLFPFDVNKSSEYFHNFSRNLLTKSEGLMGTVSTTNREASSSTLKWKELHSSMSELKCLRKRKQRKSQ